MTRALATPTFGRLLGIFAVASALFLVTASSAFACGMTCNGSYYAAGTNEARAITGNDFTGVCMGSISIDDCPAGGDYGGGGGGGGGGGIGAWATLAASPDVIAPGETSVLGWGSFGVTSCSIDQGIGYVEAPGYGSANVSPAATTKYTMTCYKPDSSVIVDDVTVTVAPPPDLVGQVGGTVNAVVGQSSVLYGGVANQSSSAAVTGVFPNIIQVCDAGCTNINQVVSASQGQFLSSGGWQAVSANFTPNNTTKRYYRVCSNTDTSWTHPQVETDYNNNCSGWQHLNVTETEVVGPALSCTVSSTNVASGGIVTYSANPSGGATGPYTWTRTPVEGVAPGTGVTETRSLTATGTHSMTVSSANAALSTCPFVTVGGGTCSDSSADLTITATPARVRSGQSTLLSWNISGASSSCSVTGPGVSWSSEVSPAPACSASGSASTNITGQSTYVLTCGTKSKSVTVNVIPNVIEF